MEFTLGMNCELHFGDEDDAIGVLTEVENVKNVTLNMEKATADATTRGNGGWRSNVGTLRTCNAEFQIQWEPGDAFFSKLLACFLSDDLVALGVLDGAPASGTGILGDFSVTNFTRNEELEGVVTVDVTCELSIYRDWIDEGTGQGETVVQQRQTERPKADTPQKQAA